MAEGFRGGIFDVDGVLVDSPHEHAWRVALDQLFETSWTSIRDATQYTSERFTPEVYRERISGTPTMSGARAALSYFGVPSTDARTAAFTSSTCASVIAGQRGSVIVRSPIASAFGKSPRVKPKRSR